MIYFLFFHSQKLISNLRAFVKSMILFFFEETCMKFMRIILIAFGFIFIFLSGKAQDFKPYDQQIPGSDIVIKMAPVNAGESTMGSPASEKGRKSDEGPQKKVKIDAFWMGAYEITFDQYDIFSDEEKDKEPIPDAITKPSPPYIDLTLGMGKAGGYPANSMSQYGALMFCKWLYKKTGIFFRLPTEAEWEYAARAGSQTPYFFGTDDNQLEDYAWYAANSQNKYHKAGELKPNPWGLYDIYGNVAEWTLDQYDENYFKKVTPDNPWLKPDAKHPRTLKGGSYKDEPGELRSATRLKSNLDWNRRDPQIPKSKWWNADAPFIGFRIIRPVKQPSPTEVEQFFDNMLSPK
jgi:formylglycine-generating enzyme required for sulfatase activity